MCDLQELKEIVENYQYFKLKIFLIKNCLYKKGGDIQIR